MQLIDYIFQPDYSIDFHRLLITFIIVPTLCVTAIKLSRHSGKDRRNPDCMDAKDPAVHGA